MCKNTALHQDLIGPGSGLGKGLESEQDQKGSVKEALLLEENKYGKVSHLGNVASEEKKETEKITDLAEAQVAHSPSPSAMKQSDPH